MSSMSETPASQPPVTARKYLFVFGAQILATILVVAAAYLPLGSASLNIAAALVIAGCQAALVLGFTMHLLSERRFIYAFLIFTLIFVAALFYLSLTAASPTGRLHYNHVS